jgi:hypothetical protein
MKIDTWRPTPIEYPISVLMSVYVAPPPVPSAPVAPMDYTAMRLAKLRDVCARYEIRPDFAAKLRQLEEYEIVALFDDSGSMATQVKKTGWQDPFAPIPTRWSEAQLHATITVDLAACLDPDGIDIRFLNRPGFSRIATSQQVAGAFAPPPTGYTPLVRAMQSIFEEKATVLRERKMLLIILTDGQPTDTAGRTQVNEFLAALKNRPKNVFVSIVACTDDASSVGYLNQLDRMVPGLDVVDDYESEKAEVLKVQGKAFPFSFGDYVVKTLLGSIDHSMDALDEKKLGGADCCCTIC